MAACAPLPLHIAVGSTNRVKVNAARAAFASAFPGRELLVAGYDVPSGVSDQPMGEEETHRGAAARAAAAAAVFAAAHGGDAPAFAVGLEGGCKTEAFALPGLAATGAGGDGGGGAGEELVCFAFMCVLQPATGRWGYARSASFSLPPEVAALVRSGVELGVADDRVFGRVDSKRSNGAIGLLTGDRITRETYYEHALLCALVPFLGANAPFFGAGGGGGAAP